MLSPTIRRALAVMAGLSAAILGGLGFVAGFVGPMILAPQANQGPMLGLLHDDLVRALGVANGTVLTQCKPKHRHGLVPGRARATARGSGAAAADDVCRLRPNHPGVNGDAMSAATHRHARH